MSSKTLSNPGRRCQLILQQCLAIQLSKQGHTPDDFWMYDSGYIVFQNFLAANTQCWWNAPLTAATRALKYAGHVAPGVLLVTAEPCALEILRGAYARSVLKPPATYVISSVGDIDDCIVTPTLQGQFTPLPEAICNVIMDLTSEGQSATIENVRKQLSTSFPHMSLPATEVIYDTLAQLMQEQKIYQTSKGYFIFTPEKRRSRSRTRSIGGTRNDCRELAEYSSEYLVCPDTPTQRSMLMTNVDALRSFFGEISTERDGDLTHQCIQTNLTDVICGGNPNDKILYPRVQKRRSSSFSSSRSLDRRHSFRLFSSSSKRLQRFSSTRSLSKTYVQSLTTDSSSSEIQSTDSSTRKKGSLLSRLFRRRSRPKNERLKTFSAQFPPPDWFNSRTVHLHSVGTQTSNDDMPSPDTQSNSTFYDVADVKSQYSPSTLSRRRSRRHLSSESTFLLSSRDCSPIRRRSPATNSSHSISSKSDKKQSIKPTITTTTTTTNNVKLEENTMPIKKREQQQQITHFDCDERYLECSPNSSLKKGSYLRSSLPVRRLKTRQEDTPSPSLSPSPTPSRFNRGFSSCGSSSLSSRSDRNRTSYSKTLPSSITLQVTASTNRDKMEPNTKIYVQNTPTHNMITFENEKLLNESNVYLINSESITNQNGELLRKTISTQNHHPSSQQQQQEVNYWQQQQQQQQQHEHENEHKPIPKDVRKKDENISIYNNNLMNRNRNIFNNNQQNNNNKMTTLNNNRRLSMPQTITSATGVHYGSTQLIYKNNVLKQHEQLSNETDEIQQQQQQQPASGNLNFYEKNNYQMLSNNTLCEAKNLRNSNNNNLNNNNNNNNNNNLAQLFLHKQMMESEPNLLAFKDNKQQQQQQQQQQQNTIQQQQKKYINSVETLTTLNDEIRCSFPTLTDISFNFTSLAAQKILQAVSLNSIDTLVELKQFQQQQQQQQQRKDATSECEETTQAATSTTTTTTNSKTICADYGLL